jgi:cyclic-di-GMP-binding protein
MPSFDIVSKINLQEVDNAINSVLREITNRYDFKGSIFSVEFKNKENLIILTADSEYRLGAIRDSLKVFATKRSIDVRAFDFKNEEKAGGNMVRQEVKLRDGLEQEVAKKIVKEVKDSKIKVQATIKGDEVRVDGKKRDDLQSVMSMLRSGNFDIPLQFINFRE